jgi:hypothetical protein
MAIRTRRRARFRRAQSGTQNLTLLIYNILKEQQAAQKSAILAAFDANMDSGTYSATYGDQAVNRAAVEAWYAAAIAAYPPGTTERDRLQAELISFRADAIAKEMRVYQDAYKNGTFAFGQKVDLNEYLRFLREAKGLVTTEAEKMTYTVEEFITVFNDRHDDLKAEGASASALLSFYRRQLSRAEEMGITKDSGHYRTIQQYIVSAQKQAAADSKRALQDKAQKILVRRAAVLAGGIEDAVNAAVREGRLSATDANKILGASPLETVGNFSNLDLGIQNNIFQSGARAGVMMGNNPISGKAWYTFIADTTDELKALIADPSLDIGTRTFLKSLHGRWVDDVARGAGLVDDIEEAYNSGLDMISDNISGYGNPMVNVDGYKKHASRVSGLASSDVAGGAVMSILNGLVPDPDMFGGKTELWQLSAQEASLLAERYTGETFLGVNPSEGILTIVNDYKVARQVETGQGFLAVTQNEFGDPVVDVVPTKFPNAVPFFYTSTMSDGTKVSSLVDQQSVAVTDRNGMPVGSVVFDIDDNGLANQKFITADNVAIDLDQMEQYMASKGIVISGNAAEGFQVTLSNDINGIVNAASLAASVINTDPSWSGIIKKRNDGTIVPWDGTTGNAGKEEAVRSVSNTLANSLSLNPETPSALQLDPATGNLVVKDEAALMRLTGGVGATQFGALMNTGAGKQMREIVSTNIFRRMESQDNRATAGQIDQTEIDKRRAMGAQAALTYETSLRDRAQNDFLAPIKAASSVIPGAPGLITLGQAAYNFINPSQGQIEATKRRAESFRPESIGKTPLGSSDYAFRYVGGADNISPLSAQPPAPATSPFTGSALGTGPQFNSGRPSEPKFTAQEIQKSLIDFRAGERSI